MIAADPGGFRPRTSSLRMRRSRWNHLAALILDLLDHGMIEFETVPETGKLAFRAISAKEEFCRFIAALKRRYAYDESTILEMLNFAYGTDKWEFDPVHLEKYARVKETLEIRTSALKVPSAASPQMMKY